MYLFDNERFYRDIPVSKLYKLHVEKVLLENVLVIAACLGWWINQFFRTTLCHGREHWGYPFSLRNSEWILNYKISPKSYFEAKHCVMEISRRLRRLKLGDSVLVLNVLKRASLSLVKCCNTDGAHRCHIEHLIELLLLPCAGRNWFLPPKNGLVVLVVSIREGVLRFEHPQTLTKSLRFSLFYFSVFSFSLVSKCPQGWILLKYKNNIRH